MNIGATASQQEVSCRCYLTLFAICFLLFFFPIEASAEILIKKDAGKSDYCWDYDFELVGKINPPDLRDLTNHLKTARSKVKDNACFERGHLTLRLNSPGGDVITAIAIGRLVRQYRMKALVIHNHSCLSACVFVLAGSVDRTVIGSVGIHRPYPSKVNESETMNTLRKKQEDLRKLITNYLKEVDVPLRLLDEMLSVPPEKIRILSKLELQSHRLVGKDPSFDEFMTAFIARIYGVSSGKFKQLENKISETCVMPHIEKEVATGLHNPDSSYEIEICKLMIYQDIGFSEAKKRYAKGLDCPDELINSKKYYDCVRKAYIGLN